MNRKAAGLAALAASLLAGPAPAQTGTTDHPIILHMKPGAGSLRLTGILREDEDCCAYIFHARAGEALAWQVSGATTRQTITSPDGQTDGPGLPPSIPLPESGTYLFTVRPDLMADGAYGPFSLTLRISPSPGT